MSCILRADIIRKIISKQRKKPSLNGRWDGMISLNHMKKLSKTRGPASTSARQGGFTLIEILVVIGIIAILAAIVIIAINPAKQFAQARNTQRQAGVNSILNAIGQRMADNKGRFDGSFTIGTSTPVTYDCSVLPTSLTPISTVEGTNAGELGCLVPTYISALPTDPAWALGTNTLYEVVVGKDCAGADNPGRVTVNAPLADNETTIPGTPAVCVTR
ncbi:MAG: hypothetical protein A3E02_02430 [Candidatus Zambryskibacteria bacterium RIFCSPHIGHO2_12_FULL_38_34]|uniref:Type II secretion system protein GspG C-terminal domain-containing protein n=1 Tax=Candidatus Zambryskibacteria bacterium RIFCSPLOWO2_12_FULL_39_16 TaxID=1802775 RepID=A0A1G2UQR1_9BACT|nr:MAG: hypothetical protein A3E02_02430 [Candidatus Zambryskibacteria bacterium RIFCSPHIGHO2_12_FULL_38_34]OHB07810.1 MAG: hypothetical protein A3I19_00480 [Candidatus Zambryskibacteria bacterium RIFCSPLOWO2_02_FULL_38_13]OHB11672.1 MAG: hypothetical protein A3G46_00135 [Candidatus Zambryskibacteria bacterium RIFCSPLOWO2_12_FULL_39_16]